jgi:hypothetical protein
MSAHTAWTTEYAVDCSQDDDWEEDNMEGEEDNMEGEEDNMEGEEDNMEDAED